MLRQVHRDARGIRVLGDVVEGFLGDPIEVGFDTARQAHILDAGDIEFAGDPKRSDQPVTRLRKAADSPR